ncbi:MAG: HEAT repeat domain-containing protein, partial [Spirochaetales bacterium]
DWVAPTLSSRDQLLYHQALLPNPVLKLEVIEALATRFKQGEVSPHDPASLFILTQLIQEGVIERRIATPPTNFPQVRKAGVELLGVIGGDQAVSILLKVLSTDPEPLVLAEAIRSLRKQKAPLTPSIFSALENLFSKVVLPKTEATLAYECLLYLRETYPLTLLSYPSEVFQYVILILEQPFPSSVKQLAREVISRWIQPYERE